MTRKIPSARTDARVACKDDEVNACKFTLVETAGGRNCGFVNLGLHKLITSLHMSGHCWLKTKMFASVWVYAERFANFN